MATPIGNLEDISYRAARLLAEVDLVAAEDTRRTAQLLRHLGVDTPMRAVHDHNEAQVADGLLDRVAAGDAIALVSDAGTPLISDPGFRLVRAARERGLPVHVVPGASAVTAALSVCGLPTDRFTFEGFLPAKAGARDKHLATLVNEPRTMVFFESSHRVRDGLAALTAAFGPDRPAALCRELTKTFETVLDGTLADIAAQVEADPDQRKGEFVLVVAGAPETPDADLARGMELARALAEHLPASQAAKVAANLTGAPRKALFNALAD
ncbi:16S rRNA (cytidine(1402)-2'-O)-methyltransferase [Marinihelvus fidelis]